MRKEFSSKVPLKGLRIAAVLHVTKETGVLARALKDAGGRWLAASNPLSTQDDIAAALVEDGIAVFAWRGQSEKEMADNRARLVRRDIGEKIDVKLEEFSEKCRAS